MTEQTGKAVKRLPMDAKYFEANGKKYHISDTLSVERWRYFEDYQALVGFGRTHSDIFEQVKKAYEALQHPKIADAVVYLHNILIGVKDKLEERHDPALMLCALFVNYDGENEQVYNEEDLKVKISDWQKEGYAMADFFTLAFNLVPSFLANYEDVLQNISSHTKEKKTTPSKGKK